MRATRIAAYAHTGSVSIDSFDTHATRRARTDWQMASAFQATDLQNGRIAGITFDVDPWRSTRRAAWPAFTWLEPRLLVGRWTREVNFIRRLPAVGVQRLSAALLGGFRTPLQAGNTSCRTARLPLEIALPIAPSAFTAANHALYRPVWNELPTYLKRNE